MDSFYFIRPSACSSSTATEPVSNHIREMVFCDSGTSPFQFHHYKILLPLPVMHIAFFIASDSRIQFLPSSSFFCLYLHACLDNHWTVFSQIWRINSSIIVALHHFSLTTKSPFHLATTIVSLLLQAHEFDFCHHISPWTCSNSPQKRMIPTSTWCAPPLISSAGESRFPRTILKEVKWNLVQ